MHSDLTDSTLFPGSPVPFEQLRPGARYRVVIEDCCVEAEFTGRFAGWERNADTPPGEPCPLEACTARFEDGSTIRSLVWFAYQA